MRQFIAHSFSAIFSRGRYLERALDDLPLDLLLLFSRISVALVFWRSGRTKVEGFSMKDSTFFLFEHEYQLPIIPPELAAYMATFAEHLFPVLLVLGVATRLSAGALLAMTAVIQFLVYPDAWPTHALWAVILLLIILRGPGAFALSRLWHAPVRM